MSSMVLAITGVKLYSPNSFPLLQMTLLILPTVSSAAVKKTFQVMLLPLVLLAKIECATDRSWSSSNSNRVNEMIKAIDFSIGFC